MLCPNSLTKNLIWTCPTLRFTDKFLWLMQPQQRQIPPPPFR